MQPLSFVIISPDAFTDRLYINLMTPRYKSHNFDANRAERSKWDIFLKFYEQHRTILAGYIVPYSKVRIGWENRGR